jgi:hypothetical protein
MKDITTLFFFQKKKKGKGKKAANKHNQGGI